METGESCRVQDQGGKVDVRKHLIETSQAGLDPTYKQCVDKRYCGNKHGFCQLSPHFVLGGPSELCHHLIIAHSCNSGTTPPGG